MLHVVPRVHPLRRDSSRVREFAERRYINLSRQRAPLAYDLSLASPSKRSWSPAFNKNIKLPIRSSGIPSLISIAKLQTSLIL